MKESKVLFIIPYAGGSSYSMNGLFKGFDRGCAICMLEPPGRGKRTDEPLINNINDLVDDLFQIMEPTIEKYDQFYIYGHSMGALLSYLLCHKFIALKKKQPLHLFISGCGGPSEREEKEKHLLPSKEFRESLVKYGGITKDVLDNDKLMDFFEPILRADFEVVERYVYKERPKLKIPITGFFGTDEDISTEEINLWNKETDKPFEIFEYPGNHFFIFEHSSEISSVLAKRIGKYTNSMF